MVTSASVLKHLPDGSKTFHPCSLMRGVTKSPASPEAEISGTWREAGGWIARQSKVISATSSIGEVDEPAQGAILEAELTLGPRTLQIRRIAGNWILTIIEEADGDTHLADDRLVATVKHGAARYRRYWTLPDDGAVDVIACRLIGFEVAP